MKLTQKIFGLALGMLLAGSAHAMPIQVETFESEGIGSRYTAAGIGVTPFCCQIWNRRSTGGLSNNSVFSGFEGADYWAGEDLNDGSLPGGFSAGNPRNIVLNAIASAASSVTVALAGSTSWDSSDFLRVFVLDSSNTKTIIDTFTGSGGRGTSTTSGQLLNTFADFSYDLTGLGAVRIGFEAWNTSNGEVLGIDNVRVFASVPAPGTIALVGIALLGLRLTRRRAA